MLSLANVAEAIKVAFEEGYSSYTSACNPMTTFEYEWTNSASKQCCDKLLKEYEILIDKLSKLR